MASLEILLLALFTIAMAIAALETEKMSRAIIALALSSVGIGSIFLLVNAYYAAVFEFLLYGGVLIILFMAVASFTEEEEEEIEEASL
jgi:NADH:ubiquinone oxidoreductase subunit 6 (subunit J)